MAARPGPGALVSCVLATVLVVFGIHPDPVIAWVRAFALVAMP
jgi:hypothetical protein